MKYRTTIDVRIDSGIETRTIKVERQEPRKSRIIEPGEPGRDRPLADYAGNRCGDQLRLIEQLVDLQAGRRRLAGALEDLADPVDHRDGRSVAVLDDTQQDRAATVVADDVLLHCPAVVHLANILDEDRLPVDVFDWNVIEVLDGPGHRIGAHRILGVADLREAGRQGQVLGIDRVHDVRRGQAPRLKLDRVDIDHDLPVFSPIWRRERDARDRGELLTEVIITVVVKPLLIKIVRGQAELQDRNA